MVKPGRTSYYGGLYVVSLKHDIITALFSGDKRLLFCCDWWISIHLSVGLFLVSVKNATIGDFNIRIRMLLKSEVKTIIAVLLLFVM